jgi:hypothetical protein
MATACKFCKGPIPSIRGGRAIFCSSVCRRKAELSPARRQKEEIHQAEERADKSLKRYIDERTALLKIGFEEKVRTNVPAKNKLRPRMLVQPDLEKE